MEAFDNLPIDNKIISFDITEKKELILIKLVKREKANSVRIHLFIKMLLSIP